MAVKFEPWKCDDYVHVMTIVINLVMALKVAANIDLDYKKILCFAARLQFMSLFPSESSSFYPDSSNLSWTSRHNSSRSMAVINKARAARGTKRFTLNLNKAQWCAQLNFPRKQNSFIVKVDFLKTSSFKTDQSRAAFTYIGWDHHKFICNFVGRKVLFFKKYGNFQIFKVVRTFFPLLM